MGAARGLSPGEAVVGEVVLALLRDRLYVMESALNDGTEDLRGGSTPEEVRAAYEQLAAAAAQVLELHIEPTAVAG